ncbi:MAG: shikimate dehydrogenase [Lachnospiraceae bacterium]|nr:shikimate dehydrogenase [Lachnospiraceae bacterium]
MESRISATTRLYALIGTPISHSGSPAMYNYSFERKGIDAAYVAFDVDREHTKDAIDALKHFNMGGMNVTMPCKLEVVKYMDELSDAARIMGAVNTVVNENGKLIGHNTDGVGFVWNLKDNGVDIKGKKMTVCGGGGAATAVQVQSVLDGIRELTIFNKKDEFFERTVETAKKLKAERPELVVNVYDIDDTDLMTKEILDSDIFVNGTVVGMKPMDDMTVVKDKAAFHKDLVVCDVVYNPIETRLLREAKECGCKTIGGKGMLLWQGVYAFKLYTGEDMPVEEVKERFFK